MDSTVDTSTMDISIQNLQTEIEWVELIHMEVEIDPDKVLVGIYPGVGRDMAIRLVQNFYYGYLEKLGPDARRFQLDRALAYSKKAAMHHAVFELPNTVQEAQQFLFADAHETEWFRYFEWDGIQEMLMHMFDALDQEGEKSGAYYEYKFFAQTIFPAARKAGITKGEMINTITQVKKMRASVAPIRIVMEWEESKKITSASADRAMRAILRMAADPQVSVRQYDLRLSKFLGKQSKRRDPLSAQLYILPDRTRIVVDVFNEKDLRFLEMGTRGVIDCSLTNPQQYFDDVTDLLKLRTLKEIVELREMKEDPNFEFTLENVVRILNEQRLS